MRGEAKVKIAGRRAWAIAFLVDNMWEGTMVVSAGDAAGEVNSESESIKLPVFRLPGVRGRWRLRMMS